MPRVLVVGLGGIGMGYDLSLDPALYSMTHSRAFHLHPGFHLAGGVDSQADRRALFTQNYGAPAFADLAAALHHVEPDVVAIATPTGSHADILRNILEATTPRLIICEKPLSMSFDASKEMVEQCAARNIAIFVNYMRRSDPGVTEIRNRLMDGRIALPVRGVVWYSKGIYNNGSHFLNLAQYLFGDVTGFRVIRPGRRWAGQDPEPDVQISFEQAKLTFLAAEEENFSHYTMEFVARNGRLRYDQGGESITWHSVINDPVVAGYSILDTAPEIISSGLDRSQSNVVAHLADYLVTGSPQFLCPGADALRTMQVLSEIEGAL